MSGAPSSSPATDVRHLGVKLKHNANSALIQGKRIVLIDDSIVRGTTSAEDRPDDARCRRARGPYADRLAADPAQLLLRRRHARALEAARRADGRRGDGATTSTPTASPSSRSTASTARSATSATAPQPQRCDACFTGDYPTTLTDCDSDGKRRRCRSSPAARHRNCMTDTKPFAGKLALVTGASRGIGAATAEALAARGRACHPDRAHRAGAGSGRGADPRRRRQRDDRAARPDRQRQYRQARRGGRRALGQPRHAGAQRRDARHR